MPDHDLLDDAPAYALHAMTADETHAVESARAAAAPEVRDQFDLEVRGYRETMAAQSATTAAAPPAGLLAAVLAKTLNAPEPITPEPITPEPIAPVVISLDAARRNRRSRWVAAISAAAAVVAIAVAGVSLSQQPSVPTQPVASQVLTASDVRTAAAPISTGGTATVLYSRDVNAAVLVMNDVAPPAPGTVYQVWLMGPDHPPQSMGTMNSAAVTPSTSAPLPGINSSTTVGLSLEPAGGSPQPTNVFATIALT